MSKKSLEDISFGEWLRRIESGGLKPSKELENILLEQLGVPEVERPGSGRFS